MCSLKRLENSGVGGDQVINFTIERNPHFLIDLDVQIDFDRLVRRLQFDRRAGGKHRRRGQRRHAQTSPYFLNSGRHDRALFLGAVMPHFETYTIIAPFGEKAAE